MIRLTALAFFVSFVITIAPARAEISRDDFFVETADGYSIFVRRIAAADPEEDLGPLLLVNGGRPGVLASWDVDAPVPSTAALFAEAGHAVYLMDARGFGRSDFTEEMQDGAEDGPVAVRSAEVVRDIAAVVEEISGRHPNDDRLAALGWATGSQWFGHYASLYPDAISHLIYYQGAYGGPAGGWPFQSIADPEDPAQLNRDEYPAFRCSTADAVTGRLAEETDNKAFLERYAALALEGDERADERDPPCFRFPSGPLADTLQMVNARPVFDASPIRSHVLILRSENDFWSRVNDVKTLIQHLSNAASVRFIEIPEASHYVHLLPDERREPFIDAVLNFTANDSAEAKN